MNTKIQDAITALSLLSDTDIKAAQAVNLHDLHGLAYLVAENTMSEISRRSGVKFLQTIPPQPIEPPAALPQDDS